MASILLFACLFVFCSTLCGHSVSVINTFDYLLTNTGEILSGGQTYDFNNDLDTNVSSSLNIITDVVDTPTEIDIEGDGWYRSKLNDEEKQAYDAIKQGIMELSASIALPNISIESLNKCFSYVLYDSPEIFWCSSGYSYRTFIDDKAYMILPKYTYTDKTTIETKQKEIDAKIEPLLSNIENMNNYYKLRAIYEWLADNCLYDDVIDTGQNIDSSLANGRSVCAGYSKAFQYICSKVGIGCLYMPGTADDGFGNIVPHAWNAASLNGKIVYIDSTWGDKDDEGPIDYSWLCLSYDDISRSHYLDDISTTPTGDTTNTYDTWHINNTMLDSYDATTLLELLVSSVKRGDTSISIRFANSTELDRAYTELFDTSIYSRSLSRAVPEAFEHSSENGMFTVYKNATLNAMVIVWHR